MNPVNAGTEAMEDSESMTPPVSPLTPSEQLPQPMEIDIFEEVEFEEIPKLGIR